MDFIVDNIIGIIALAALAGYALYCNQTEIAAASVGAIAGYVAKQAEGKS